MLLASYQELKSNSNNYYYFVLYLTGKSYFCYYLPVLTNTIPGLSGSRRYHKYWIIRTNLTSNEVKRESDFSFTINFLSPHQIYYQKVQFQLMFNVKIVLEVILCGSLTFYSNCFITIVSTVIKFL